MNLRVNLIHESEIRQPGLLTPRTILRVSAFAVVILVIAAVATALLRAQAVGRALRQAKARFRQVDPVFQDVRAVQRDLAFDQGLYKDLLLWAAWRFEWEKILSDLQKAVPPTIQLTRLTVRSTMFMIPPPKWEKKALPVPARKFSLRLDGRAAGERGDEVVLEFVRGLRQAEGLESLLESVRLATGLKKAPSRPGEPESWEFAIEAESAPRKME